MKKKVKRRRSNRLDLGIKEVSIRLPRTLKNEDLKTDFYWSGQGRGCVLGKSILYIPCKADMHIDELKSKIGGKIKIPPERMKLFYAGKLLLDHDVIPISAFDDLTDAESDEDIFKARIFLSIKFIDPIHNNEETKGRDRCEIIDTNLGGDDSNYRHILDEDGNELGIIPSFENRSGIYTKENGGSPDFDILKELRYKSLTNLHVKPHRSGGSQRS